MKVLKKFNNNVIMSLDKNDNEMVLIGNGLGFAVSPGDEIDKTKIEKRFSIDGKYSPETIVNLLNDIPDELFNTTKKIIKLAEKELLVKLSDYVYLSLSDHLNYAYKRLDIGVENKNPLLNEIRLVYPKEFKVATMSLEIIENENGRSLPIEEAGFIALHLVNGQMGQETINETMKVPKMIKEILKIIEFHFSIELDKTEVSYDRFINHLKYFVSRSLKGGYNGNIRVDVNQTKRMLESMKTNFPKIMSGVDKIVDYMKKRQNINIADDEKFYLFVYLHKLTS